MRRITTLTIIGFFMFNYSFGQNLKKTLASNENQLIAILDTIYEGDKKYRTQINDIAEKYGWESNELKEHVKIMTEQYSINTIKIRKILDEYGWLGTDIIGNQGNTTLFLVIQHSDFETQEKYLPMMREAVQKGNAKASDLAFLEDRIALRKGEKQIYGSQIAPDPETGEYIILPLIDPENIDKRRAEDGLSKFQDYISGFGLTWNVEEYKKKLPELEMKYRNYLNEKRKKELKQ